MQDLSKKLKLLLERKANADLLSEIEKIKWRDSIKKLNDEIVQTQDALYNESHPVRWSFDKLDELLTKAVKQATLEAIVLEWEYDIAFKKFLEENKINQQELIVAGDEVEYSFKIRNSTKCIVAIHNYSLKIKEVVKTFIVQKYTGIKPLSSAEAQQLSIEDVFKNEGSI